MSEAERLDSDRRTFLKQFAIGAAAVPLVTYGVFKSPNINGCADGYGYEHCEDGDGDGVVYG